MASAHAARRAVLRTMRRDWRPPERHREIAQTKRGKVDKSQKGGRWTERCALWLTDTVGMEQLRWSASAPTFKIPTQIVTVVAFTLYSYYKERIGRHTLIRAERRPALARHVIGF